MLIKLTVIAGPHRGQVFEFREHDTFLVGRGGKAHFRLPQKDQFFSRIHFMMEVNPPACRIMDMGSTNGTFVNQARVESADLRNGDLISGGDTVFRVEISGEPTPAGKSPVSGPEMPQKGSTAPLPVPAAPVIRSGHSQRKPPPSVPPVTPALEPETVSEDSPCPVCQKLLEASRSVRVSPELLQLLPRICRECLQQMEQQEQPIPEYRILRELGRGGMGVVHLGVEVSSGLPRAVKTIIPAVVGSRADLDRFVREATILQTLEHDHIVRYHNLGETNGVLYFAMEFVRGANAEDYVEKKGALPLKLAVNLTCQLLDALQHAHENGFVHRDIKPSNLLMTRRNNAPLVKLADFGLAKVYNESRLSGLTMTGEVRCSVPFVAPEQILNYRQSQPSSDIYAAAATLYFLLTGEYIFEFPVRMEQRLLTILQADPVPIQERVSQVPDGIAQVIHQGLQKEPDQRYADALTFAQALQRELAR